MLLVRVNAVYIDSGGNLTVVDACVIVPDSAIFFLLVLLKGLTAMTRFSEEA